MADAYAPSAQVIWNEAKVLRHGPLQQCAACFAGKGLIVTECAGPFWLEYLDGAVDGVSAEHQTLLSSCRNFQSDLSRSVAG
jgi:hypothetical protein